MSEQDLYWLTRLDSLRELMSGFALLFLMVGVLYIVPRLVSWADSDVPKIFRSRVAFVLSVLAVVVGLVLVAGKAFVPTTKEMAAIKVIPMITNNEDVKEIGKDVLDLAKDYVKELKSKDD